MEKIEIVEITKDGCPGYAIRKVTEHVLSTDIQWWDVEDEEFAGFLGSAWMESPVDALNEYKTCLDIVKAQSDNGTVISPNDLAIEAAQEIIAGEDEDEDDEDADYRTVADELLKKFVSRRGVKSQIGGAGIKRIDINDYDPHTGWEKLIDELEKHRKKK